MQFEPPLLAGPEPLCRLDPNRMPGAVVVSEGSDPFGKDLDPARWRLERPSFRISTEIAKKIEMSRRRVCEITGLPEALEIRAHDAMAGCLLSRDFVEMAQPFHFAATLREGLTK